MKFILKYFPRYIFLVSQNLYFKLGQILDILTEDKF
jgi:hypothetical protein